MFLLCMLQMKVKIRAQDSLCVELEQAFEQFPKYLVKFLQKISVEDCINYCGLSLLSASYELLPNILLSR